MSAIYMRPKRWEISEVIAEDTLAVSVAEFKAEARMDATDTLLNSSIERNIKAIQRRIEKYCNLVLFRSKLIGYYDEFPNAMMINRNPEVELIDVKYEDLNGVTQIADEIQLQKFDKYAVVILKDGAVYPSVKEYTVDSVRVSIYAGYANANAVPDDIKQAIIMSVMPLMFGDCNTGDILTDGSKAFLDPYMDSLAWLR